MKITASVFLIMLVVIAAPFALVSTGAGQEARRKMTKEDVDRLMTELSNWGRWERKISSAQST